jgi:hypothetical protein
MFIIYKEKMSKFDEEANKQYIIIRKIIEDSHTIGETIEQVIHNKISDEKKKILGEIESIIESDISEFLTNSNKSNKSKKVLDEAALKQIFPTRTIRKIKREFLDSITSADEKNKKSEVSKVSKESKESEKTQETEWEKGLRENIGWTVDDNRETNFCFLNESVYDENKVLSDTCVEENWNGKKCKNFNSNNCYTASDSDKNVYKSIDRFKFDTVFEGFAEFLNSTVNSDDNFKRKFQEIYQLDAEGTIPNLEFQPKRIGNLEAASKCGDIMFNFEMLCKKNGALAQSGIYRSFFHIALHSEKPKLVKEYIKDEEKKKNIQDTRYACGYYKKKPDETEGSGTFHYKIDNVIPTKTLSKENCNKKIPHNLHPYKKFVFLDGITMEQNDREFENNITMEQYNNLFGKSAPSEQENGKFKDEEKFSEHYHKIKEIHNHIYNLFVNYWNVNVSDFLHSSPDFESTGKGGKNKNNKNNKNNTNNTNNKNNTNKQMNKNKNKNKNKTRKNQNKKIKNKTRGKK